MKLSRVTYHSFLGLVMGVLGVIATSDFEQDSESVAKGTALTILGEQMAGRLDRLVINSRTRPLTAEEEKEALELAKKASVLFLADSGSFG